MVYLVYSSIEGAAFINHKMNGPANAYGETFEKERAAEAWAYFWVIVETIAKTRAEITERGAKTFTVLIAELENEESTRPSRELARVTMTAHGVTEIQGNHKTMEEARRRIKEAGGQDSTITNEPQTFEQMQEAAELDGGKKPGRA